MKEEAGQYLKSAVIWARESKQTLKEMKADGKGDTPEYAAIAASVATYQVLQGIALLVEERNERAEERARDVDARLSSLVDGLAGIRGDLKHLEVEVDEPRLAEADFEPVLQKLDEITRAIEENKFDWDSREASELKSDVRSMKGDVSDLKSDVSWIHSDVGSIRSEVSSIESDVSSIQMNSY